MNISQKISQLKDNFKNLNPKEFYAWPISVQILLGIGVFIATMIIGFSLHLVNQQGLLEDEKNKEVKLKEEFTTKTQQAVNLNLYVQQLEEITKVSDNLLKQLPKSSEVEKLLLDINQAGVSKGLTFDLFKPGEEKIYDFYAELPIKIKVVGSYDSIGKFVAEISQLSRVVLLADMNVSNKENVTNPTLINMETEARTFRYLDADEIEKQKLLKQKEKEKEKKMGKSNEKEEKTPKH